VNKKKKRRRNLTCSWDEFSADRIGIRGGGGGGPPNSQKGGIHRTAGRASEKREGIGLLGEAIALTEGRWRCGAEPKKRNPGEGDPEGTLKDNSTGKRGGKGGTNGKIYRLTTTIREKRSFHRNLPECTEREIEGRRRGALLGRGTYLKKKLRTAGRSTITKSSPSYNPRGGGREGGKEKNATRLKRKKKETWRMLVHNLKEHRSF